MILTSKNKFCRAFINVSLVFNFRRITRLAVSLKYRSHKILYRGDSWWNKTNIKFGKTGIRDGYNFWRLVKKCLTYHTPEEAGAKEIFNCPMFHIANDFVQFQGFFNPLFPVNYMKRNPEQPIITPLRQIEIKNPQVHFIKINIFDRKWM